MLLKGKRLLYDGTMVFMVSRGIASPDHFAQFLSLGVLEGGLESENEGIVG